MGLQDFIENNEPKGKRSKLLPHLDDILTLLDLGYSQEQVCEYLETDKGITITQTGLSRFLARHVKKDDKPAITTTEQSREKSHSERPAPSIFEKKKKAEVDLDDLMNED